MAKNVLIQTQRRGNSACLRALRTLYWNFSEQNTLEARARRLLREWLSPEQCAQFDAESYFDVTGSHTGRRYRFTMVP